MFRFFLTLTQEIFIKLGTCFKKAFSSISINLPSLRVGRLGSPTIDLTVKSNGWEYVIISLTCVPIALLRFLVKLIHKFWESIKV